MFSYVLEVVLSIKIGFILVRPPNGGALGVPLPQNWNFGCKGGKHWSSNLAKTCKTMCLQFFWFLDVSTTAH